jgi:hypothetical protein
MNFCKKEKRKVPPLSYRDTTTDEKGERKTMQIGKIFARDLKAPKRMLCSKHKNPCRSIMKNPVQRSPNDAAEKPDDATNHPIPQ